jgi:hypothetical protein
MLLDELIGAVGTRPRTCMREGMSVRDLKRSFGDPDPHETTVRVTTSRSEFFARPLPTTVIARLLDELADGPTNERRELNFTAMGGAYNRVAPDATAFVHRSEQFLLEHVTDGDAQWVERSWAIAHEHGSGRVYPNFPDPALRDWEQAYYGGNLARLAAAKRSYDAERFFRFPQGL